MSFGLGGGLAVLGLGVALGLGVDFVWVVPFEVARVRLAGSPSAPPGVTFSLALFLAGILLRNDGKQMEVLGLCDIIAAT